MGNEDYALLQIKCGYCDGTGKIPNDDFEACMKAGDKDRDCHRCPDFNECRKGEEIDCEYCQGRGTFLIYGKVKVAEAVGDE